MKQRQLIKNTAPRFFQSRFFAIGVLLFVTHFTPVKLFSQNTSGSLELLDGSVLHGRLGAIDSGKGLRWEYPDAKTPIDFKPENLAWVHFAITNKGEVSGSNTTCQIRFANGDESLGKLVALNENEVEMQTWFGGTLKTPRSALRSLRFIPNGSLTVYEGPTSLQEWQLGKNQNPQAWQFSDGALIANAVGTVGRDMHLPASSRLEFDLAWNAPFSLLFSYYTEVFDGFNYNSSAYMFYINPGNVSLQRINAGAGSSTLGRTETIAAMLKKKKVHLEFRGSKAENLLELLVDGKLVSQWKDNAGWVGKGSGILFYAQTDGANLKISNMKVSEWDGKPGDEIMTNAPAGEDQLHLANRDKVSGKVIKLRDGKLNIQTPASSLEIPTERVTQIFFGNLATNSNAHSPWEIRAFVSGGGRISFALEKWSAEKVSGRNENLGNISLSSQSIRHIQFNLGKSKADPELDASEDPTWEINEP